MDTVVYEWRREDGSPYYIGIGRPERPYIGRRCCGTPPPRDRIVILHEGLDWKKACEIEKELIALHGRKDLGTGILRNLTNGGDGVRGLIVSERSKIKMSKAKKGKKLTKEHKELLTGKNSSRYIPRNWYHPEYGEIVETSLSDLVKMFPDQKLDSSSLSKIANGKLFDHKGWRLLENKDKIRQNGTPRNWCHSTYGFFQDTSSADLIKRYPEDKLSISGFSHLVHGKSNYYKGWVFIDKSLIDISLSKGQLDKIFSKEYAINKINNAKEGAREKLKNRDSRAHTIKNWYHPNHGVVRNISIPDLVKKYSVGCKLSLGLLYAVVWGDRSHHWGWTLYEVPTLEGETRNTDPKIFTGVEKPPPEPSEKNLNDHDRSF